MKQIVIGYNDKGVQTFNFYEIAREAGLESWYIFYRRLSNYAAHPSLDSLQYFFDENQESVVFEPNSESTKILDTADMLCTFLIFCCNTFNEHLWNDESLAASLHSEFEKIQKWQLSEP